MKRWSLHGGVRLRFYVPGWGEKGVHCRIRAGDCAGGRLGSSDGGQDGPSGVPGFMSKGEFQSFYMFSAGWVSRSFVVWNR